MNSSTSDYRKAYRKNLNNQFRNRLVFFLQSTKPFILLIESSSIFERFATAKSLAEKLLEFSRALELKSRIRYAFNDDDFEREIKFCRKNDILIADCEKVSDARFRKEFELKNLNILALTSQPVELQYTYRLQIYKEELNSFFCLVFKHDQPRGVITIEKRAVDYEKLILELKSPIQRIVENSAASTKKLLEKMYIPQEIIFIKKEEDLRKTENAIIPQKILVYGDVGTGKSTLLEILHQLDIKKYGSDHVHARLHEDDLNSLLVRGWSKNKDQFIQSIAVEDYTYKGEKDLFTMHSFINLRHTMNERSGGTRVDRTFGLQQGMAKCSICLHRLTGDATPTAYRSSFDFQFFLSFPTLKFDRDYIEQIIGPVYVAVLKYITEKRNTAKEKGKQAEYLKWLGWGIWVYGEERGIFHLPISKYAPLAIELLDAPEGSADDEEISHWHDWEIDTINRASEHLAFATVAFNGRDPIRINLWGSRQADVPRWDVDLTERFLIEEYPETRELIPRRRRSLAKDVFQRAKYLQYSEIAPERLEEFALEEKISLLQENFAKKNWKRIADEGIDHFTKQDGKPKLMGINEWVLDHWKYHQKHLPKSISKVGYFSLITTKIRAALDKYFLKVNSESTRENKDLVIHPGSIVDKYRQSIKDHAAAIGQEQSFDDLINNHFELQSLKQIADARDVVKSSVSTNIKRAERTLHKKALSGNLWEASIFSWSYEQLEQLAREKDLILDKVVDGQLVEMFPSRDNNQSYFAIGVRTASFQHFTPPYIVESIESITGPLFANPLGVDFFALFAATGYSLVFLWLAGKSTVDFLLLSPAAILVFDAKVSHQAWSGSARHSSHTVSHESLVPQSLLLSVCGELSAAADLSVSAGISFWSPFIGPRFASQPAADLSVTINAHSSLLEPSLTKFLRDALKTSPSLGAAATSAIGPSIAPGGSVLIDEGQEKDEGR